MENRMGGNSTPLLRKLTLTDLQGLNAAEKAISPDPCDAGVIAH